MWSNLGATNNTVTPTNPAPVFYSPAATTIAGGEIKRTDNTTLYVDGDLQINGNITAESGAGSIAEIPSFTVIVRGNIYIAPNVTELYGTYVAQPNGSDGGRIYTCGTNRVAHNPMTGTAASVNNDYNTCRTRLVVTGSFVAKKVHLLRTYGTRLSDRGSDVAGSGNVPPATAGSGYERAAEVFQYNPLMWLRQSSTADEDRGFIYDAATSLPPVL
jgi:hypothetical protein